MSAAAPIRGHGYIYLVLSEDQNLGKIGYCSEPPEQRLCAMQTGNPALLRLECVIPGTRRQEGIIHKVLAEYRQTGEWFRDPDLLRIVFDVLYSEAMNDDDILEELSDEDVRKAVTEGLDEALHGVE